MKSLYTLRNLGISYGECPVLDGISLGFNQPGLTAIVGPNGAGKSSLLGAMAGLRSPYTGSCTFHDVEIRDWKRGLLTREVAFVPQTLRLEFPFTAEQVVLMGRTPHTHGLFESAHDWQQVSEAMEVTGTLGLRQRDFRCMSGGEKQRVILASALAQRPKVLLLDEPTTFLDLRHQLSIYELLRKLADSGLLIITVTHDLNLAASFCDRVIALHRGSVAADGTPREALTTERIAAVFDVAARHLELPNGRTWIAYGD